MKQFILGDDENNNRLSFVDLFQEAMVYRGDQTKTHIVGEIYKIMRERIELIEGRSMTKNGMTKRVQKMIRRWDKGDRDYVFERLRQYDVDFSEVSDLHDFGTILPSPPSSEESEENSKKPMEPSKTIQEIMGGELPYYYDETNDKYIFSIKSYPKPLVISGSELHLIKERYSNWDGLPSSINAIARDFSIPRKALIDVLRRMGWTHDSDPFSDKDLLTRPEGDLVEEVLLNKRRIVLQKIEQKSWDMIKEDAKKFREIEHTVVHPLMDAINNRQGKFKAFNIKINTDGSKKRKLSVVLPIMDIHMGKLPFYVRGEYTFDQFQRECESALQEILNKVMAYCTPDEIVTIVGSDWFHVDNIKHSTSELTSQAGQMIGSYWDVVVRGYDLAFAMFDSLVNLGYPVYGYEVDGNHDRILSLNLSLALQQRYRDQKHVKIHSSPDNRKYHVYGTNLYSFLHGDFLKQQAGGRQKSILTNIHNDTKRLKINTLDIHNYVVFSGHVHKKSLNFDEDSGILDVVVPSLSTTDMWHHNNSYEGNRRAVSAFLYSKDSKHMDILSYNL